jgi:hypothetical protein
MTRIKDSQTKNDTKNVCYNFAQKVDVTLHQKVSQKRYPTSFKLADAKIILRLMFCFFWGFNF